MARKEVRSSRIRPSQRSNQIHVRAAPAIHRTEPPWQLRAPLQRINHSEQKKKRMPVRAANYNFYNELNMTFVRHISNPISSDDKSTFAPVNLSDSGSEQRITSTKKAKSGSKFGSNRIFAVEQQCRYHPELAAEIGQNESILLLQFDYWIAIANHEFDGHRWTYQSVKEIHAKIFPHLTERTVKRLVKSLKDKNLIITGNFNRYKYDRTTWYAMNLKEAAKLKAIAIRPEVLTDYDPLEAETLETGEDKMSPPLGPNITIDDDKMSLPIPETSTKTSPENTRNTEVALQKNATLPFANEVILRKEHGGASGSDPNNPFEDARDAWAALRSVGVERADITFLDDLAESKQGRVRNFYGNIDPTERWERTDGDALMNGLLRNGKVKESFIIRPRSEFLIQVDDCDLERVRLLRDYSFLVIETSRGNYQVWLALSDTSTPDRDETRRRLLEKLGGDVEASGAMRFPGSINWKPVRNAFRVRLVDSENGRVTSSEELERAGLLAEKSRKTAHATSSRGYKSKLPDYQKCLAYKDYDRSEADASYMAICMDRGFSREETISALMQVSDRANEGGECYVARTADFVFGF